jgi:hypothetical protein
MSLRKTRLVPAEPKVGRYRLFDWLPKGRRRCRLCGSRMRLGNIWRHWETEVVKHPHAVYAVDCDACFKNGLDCGAALEPVVAMNLRARRSRRNRAHAQYQYATRGEPWRRR